MSASLLKSIGNSTLSVTLFFGAIVTPASPQGNRLVLEVDLVYPPSEAAVLSDVWHVLPSSDGTIYVVDRQNRSIEVFGGDGRHIQTIGREGGGPGEFRGPPFVGWIGDTLWALDMASQRVTLFDSSGNDLEVFPVTQLPHVDPYSVLQPRHLLADRTVLVTERYSTSFFEEFERRGELLQRSSLNGEVVDTIRRASVRNRLLRFHSGDGRTTLQTSQPWSDSDLWAVSPTGGWIALVERPAPEGGEGTYHLTQIPIEDTPPLERTFREKARRLSNEMEAEWVERAVARYFSPERFRSRADARRAVRGALFRPSHLPLVRAVFVGLDGKIWVQREDQGNLPERWDVYDRGQERPAIVFGPENAVLLAASNDFVWGITKDELDIPHIVRYRVISAPPFHP